MHNIMPVSSAIPMHGTMGGVVGNSGGLGPATVAAGATLPRRRGPFGSPAQGCHLPAQPQPPTASSIANRPLPIAGAFDPNTGRPLVPPNTNVIASTSASTAAQQSRPDKEVGI